MSNLLFLVHRIPFPPDKGDKIRSYNMLRYLSSRYAVYLGTFIDDPDDKVHQTALNKYCEEIFVCSSGGWKSKVNAAAGAIRGHALGVGYYRDSKMYEWVDNKLRSQKIDHIIAFSSTMAQYAMRPAGHGVPVTVDLVDVDSDKWIQYSAEQSFPASLLYRYEGRALAEWERHIAESVDTVTLVSDAEKSLFERILRSTPAKVEVIRNGVDVEFFDPHLEFENPYVSDDPVVIFTGAMDYYANVNAVVWFAQKVWRHVRKRATNAQFHIVGRNPATAVRNLAAEAGVTVVGGVPDVRPYLRHATLSVAPLRVARGVQNKVLESLAMDLPVVATPEAVRGIDGVLPESISVAKSPSDYADLIMSTLDTNRPGMSASGRAFVEKHYAWEENLSEFSRLIDHGGDHSRKRQDENRDAGLETSEGS